MNWDIESAKNKLSELIQQALEKGPQTIIVRGNPAVVVLAAEHYQGLVGAKPSLAEYLLSGPEWDDEFIEEVNRRSETMIRDVDL